MQSFKVAINIQHHITSNHPYIRKKTGTPLSMAKSMVIAAVFLAFLASANAMTIRTTITTTTIDEEIDQGQETQQCRNKVRGAMQLRECTMYISEGSSYGVALIDMRMVANPGEQMLQQCCKKLANVAEECRCNVMEEITRVMQQQQGQGHESEKLTKKIMKIKNLPTMCNMEPKVC